ncbi:RNA polymerase sigma factor SigJ [Isoptericola sp. NPDC057653]|uniref:RNA polymerase sigma factor SigJ n=1 Tax=Isoptericola sp. NPDC057653 TaxID=3346195 RepID=UPI0036B954D8
MEERVPTGDVRDGAALEGERGRLVGLAYRMLGTTAEAEDAVQEAFVRWYRLDDAARSAITNPAGWLTRVTSRVCLDVLGSARVRRERYVGPWLPEPVPGDLFARDGGADVADPADRVVRDESVSTALLVVLEAMTPAERVAFVLHDVFGHTFADVAEVLGRTPAAARQLASSARAHARAGRSGEVAAGEHDRVVAAFARAAGGDDLAALTALLDPSVELRSDGGGVARAALNPVHGASKVARFLLGVLHRQADARLEPRSTADGAALAFVRGGRVTGVVNVAVVAGRVTAVWVQWNPDKLTRWNPPV